MFLADGWSAIFKVMIALLTHATPHILGESSVSLSYEWHSLCFV